MAKIKVDFDTKDLRQNLSRFDSKLNNNVARLFDYNAGYTTGWLKQNAPWHDDTGAARSGLTTIPFSAGNKHELLMSYSVTYGIWLEIANSGQWSVIIPAMRVVGHKVMSDLRMLLNKMGG